MKLKLKKPVYKVKSALREHLKQYSLYANLPISYDDLTCYRELLPSYDDGDNATLWFLVLYDSFELDRLQKN